MRDCTTAVVLAAGSGSRMRRDASGAGLTPDQAAQAARGIKGMIPDARGRPFLDHVLLSLADAGVADVCVIIGPRHDVIREHYARRAPQRVALSFVVQPVPRGTADALLAAEAWIDGRDFLVVNADNLYPVPAIRALVSLGAPGLVAFDRGALVREGNIEPARIAAYALLSIRDDGALAAIVEKPPAGSSLLDDATATQWISMNLWRFDQGIFAACRDVSPSPRGELELPLAVALAIARGARLRVVPIAAGVLDLSNRGDVADVARRLAERDVVL